MAESHQQLASDLRALADLIEAQGNSLPEFRISVDGIVWPDDGDVKQRMAAAAKVLPHPVTKLVTDHYLYLQARLGGDIKLSVATMREAVCIRREVGTRTIPATPATEARQVPVYEWICEPILAGVPDGE